ncbi:MAG TPA: LytTR family transcriptional regulator DNA-binding domain-containing protein [Bacteroidales bacterium]|nr:LytTR family transcriptional regulator DNA-binding domain-containing protein [Bacteroidales bacterium]
MKTTINKRSAFLIFFFVICGLVSAQPVNKTDTLGRKQGYWKKYVKDTLKYEGAFINDKPTGEFKYYYPNGKIKAVTAYSDSGSKAQTIMYFNNGTKNAEGLYIDKKKEGLWVYYGINGIKISEENYKTGIKEGTWKYFYDNGKINRIENYKNNMLEGEAMDFYADSILKLKCSYQNGKLNGKYQYFYDSGKILFTGVYKNDFQEGVWMFFDENSLGNRKLTYNKGQRVKEEILVKDNGPGTWVVVDDVAYCFSENKEVHIKKNSGEEIITTTPLDDLEKRLDQFNFFRISPDFLISRWSLKNRKAFTKENPVLVLNPECGKLVKVNPDKIEGFMSWASLMKYE